MWAKCQRFSHSHFIKVPDLLKEKQKEMLGRKTNTERETKGQGYIVNVREVKVVRSVS